MGCSRTMQKAMTANTLKNIPSIGQTTCSCPRSPRSCKATPRRSASSSEPARLRGRSGRRLSRSSRRTAGLSGSSMRHPRGDVRRRLCRLCSPSPRTAASHRRIAYLLGKAQRYCDRSDDGENDEQDHNAFEALRVVHSHNMVFHIFMLLIKQICPLTGTSPV